MERLLTLFIAFTLDLLIGDPVYPLHPVRLIGKLVNVFETLLEKIKMSSKIKGVILYLGINAIYIGIYNIILNFITSYYLELIINTFILYSCIAFKDLFNHASNIIKAIKNEPLNIIQMEVQKIVGRDAKKLDIYGICRATIESIAEGFVDGLLSPLFWYNVGCLFFDTKLGITFAIIYRITNTLDSMVGYKNEKYKDFGFFSAKMDDILNFIPARLSILFISIASLLNENDFHNCIKIFLRDRLKHSSPNAAHAESAIAGAINISLGGPTIYNYGIVEKPWLGNGSKKANFKDIKKTIYLINISGLLAILLSEIILFSKIL